MDIFELLKQPHDVNPGGAAPYLEGFCAQIAAVGYTALTINGCLSSAIHFGGWVESNGLDFADINDETIQAFRAHHCRCPGRRTQKHVSRHHVGRVQRFTEYLRQQDVIRMAKSPTEILSPLGPFRDWLLRHRGLVLATVERHERLMTKMLPALGPNAGEYDAASVRTVILDQIGGCHPAQAKTIIGRSASICDSSRRTAPVNLVSTICFRPWRSGGFPRRRSTSTPIRQPSLLTSCSKDGPQGSRDRAIVLLLLRLRLRAGDIASMRPSDIDWQDATLLVRGKGRRDFRLPLPQDAGDAALDYIESVRPQVAIDRVFLCANAPVRPLRAGMIVSGIVRAALRRAGIENPPSHGANLLRHTVATMMLRGGATLDQIGTVVLRYKSPDTTAHYAKVDMATLQEITQPWRKESR